jgi:dihydropteroate synthase
MGIVNVTPDSFSDGGRWTDPAAAVQHALQLLDEGADILDFGGESTRPGAEPVAADEEMRRVVPVIAEVARLRPSAMLSIDTTKAVVACAALEAGAHILNDVSAGRADPCLLPLAAESGAGLVLMHRLGEARHMQDNPVYGDVVGEVLDFFRERRTAALAAGLSAEQLVFDPGIGFGKRLEHNLALLAALPRLADIGRPLLLGVSRKRWLGEITGRGVEGRLAGSLGGLAACIMGGAQIIRVHDVKESCDMARVLDRVRNVTLTPAPCS